MVTICKNDYSLEALVNDNKPQRELGSGQYIFYKSHYYKIQNEGKKSFIITKIDGNVSITDVIRWLKENQ